MSTFAVESILTRSTNVVNTSYGQTLQNVYESIHTKRRSDMSIFTERLREELDRQHVSANEMARRLGISRSTVSKWFNRDSMPNRGIINSIAEMLNVNPDWLLGNTADKEREYDLQIDMDLVTALRSLNPQQIQRVKDFVSGLKG